MRAILFILILTLFPLASAGAVSCILKSTADNPLVAERMCETRFNAECSCRQHGEGMGCIVDFRDDLEVSCLGGKCTATFLGSSEAVRLPFLDAQLVQSLCEATTGAKCRCHSAGSSAVKCSITDAEVLLSCDVKGCTADIGDYSRRLPYCSEAAEVFVERTGEKMQVRVEGLVKGAENGLKQLDDGIISISGQLEDGVSVEIIAEMSSIELGSDVRAQRAQLHDEVKAKFQEALLVKRGSVDFNTIDAIEIHHGLIQDGGHIRSATLRFRVPKLLVDGEVVILRYGDDGSVDVLSPTISEEGEFYIYEVSTGGLSLYAVATVKQISGPVAEQPIPIAQGDTEGRVCGTAGLILLLLILSFFGRRSAVL